MQSFKHKFNVPTKEFKKYGSEEIELTITPRIIEGHKLLFSMRIPEYIYQALIDSEEKYMKSRSNKSQWIEKEIKFKKEIESETLSDLVTKFYQICSDAKWFMEVLSADYKKVICVKFEHSSQKKIGAFNHAPMGKKVQSSFQFFVAYKLLKHGFFSDSLSVYQHRDVDDFKKTRYHDGQGNIENNFDVIEWTQEREDFLKNVEEQFEKLNSKLSEFLTGITDDKMNQLMSNFKMLQLEEKKE